MNFANFLPGGSVNQNAGAGTAINEFTSGSNGNANITNQVALYSDATDTNVDDTTAIAGIINSNDFSFTAGGKMILITGDAGGVNDPARIWFIDSALDGNGANVTATDVVLAGITSADFDLDTLITTNFGFAADPIILDLGADGISFTDVANGVSFDADGDGDEEQIAWTTGEDGVLALDVDGSGAIENGTEIFSPDFAGGGHVNSVAALATLDSNDDSVIDAGDDRFDELLVWTDTNHDGVSDGGELHSLADLGIESIDLAAVFAASEIDGQHVFATGTFTLEGGETRDYVGVNFSSTQTALAEIENPQPAC
jgi:hypothetical protein